jgi:imidazolonepropionase-like amidohydrolase
MRRLVTVTFVALCFPAAVGSAQEVLVLRSATVIDGRGGPPRDRTTVVVRAGRISAVGPDRATPVPSGATVLDARGRWVIPGLIEVHSHDTDRQPLQQALALGVTSALVIGVSDTVLYLEQWSAQPSSAAPRLYITPGGFSGEFPDNVFPGLIRVARPRSPAEASRDVAKLRSRGATQLKIWQDDGRLWSDSPEPLLTLAPAVVQEIVRSAHRRGMRVYAHAWQMRYAREAVAAGVDALIHPIADSLADQELLRILARRRMPWVTTLTGLDAFYDPRTYARRVLGDSRLKAALPGPKEHAASSLLRQRLAWPSDWDALEQRARDTVPYGTTQHPVPNLARNYRSYRETVIRNTLAAWRAGVPLAVGSDQPIGLGTHIEMELLVEAGLTPAEVLRAASAGGARVLGLERELGTIEVGKRADLVVLRANPFLDIRNARDVEWTIKGGTRFRDGTLVP